MIEQEYGQEEIKDFDWLEIRKDTVQDLVWPLNLLIQEAARIKEKQAALERAKQLQSPGLNSALETIEEAVWQIAASAHLTVGGWSCPCQRCRPMITATNQAMPGDIVRCDKNIHQEFSGAEPPIRRGQWVQVATPFIGDNLLQEVIQPIKVVALSQTQPGRRYRPQYFRSS